MKRKVCMVTSVHRHNDVRIYHKEAKALAEAGYGVTILAPDYAGVDEMGIRFIQMELPENRARRILLANRRIGRAIERLGADIYHFHDPELLPSALLAKRLGCGAVYDAHEDVPRQMMAKEWLPRPLRGPGSMLVSEYEEWAASRLDLTIGATRSIAGKFENGTAIHNYPDPAEFPGTGPRPGSRTFCYVGALTRARGIGVLAAAVRQTTGLLALAGEFEDLAFKEQILLGTGQSVSYHGYLGREKVAELLSQSAAGMLLLEPTPGYLRSMPIKLFEYLLAGLPVIASDFPFWRRLIGEECALFVPPGNVAAAASAMRWVLEHPRKAADMGRKGRQLVLRRFSFEMEKERLIEAYGQISLDR